MPVASSKAKRLVNNFRLAVGNYAFKGSAHPDTWDDSEKAYRTNRQKLLDYIAELEHDYAEVTLAIARAVK